MDYRTAGVDISAGEQVVAGIKRLMGASGSAIGHFGGAFPINLEGYKKPLIVSSVDGVGTKTSVAAACGCWEVIGRDMVHHAIGDIAVCGAEPLFFLDYIAMGKLDSDAAIRVVGGAIDACKRWGVTLVGGETAELPGVYVPGELDFVGCIVGVVDQEEYIDGKTIVEGDILVGFPSVGLHTNGFSLARRVFNDANISFNRTFPELDGSLADALLAEHRCYLEVIRRLKRDFGVKGLAHITGGGIEGNSSRIIPKGLKPEFDWGVWQELPIFDLIRRTGKVPEEDMRRTFNLGIGLVAALSPDMASKAIGMTWGEWGEPVVVGRIVAGGIQPNVS